jgi:endonuclease G, mitochondrial
MKPETTERVVDATARYQQRVKHVDAPPPVQSKREKYLSRNLARTKATLLANEAEAAGAVASATASLAQLSQERIVGTSDLFDINYLELAIAVGRSVARIQIGSFNATGFLIGPELLITNHHVLETEDDARRAVAQFDYQDNASGELLVRQDYRLNPAKFFVTDKLLDFTIVGVESQSVRNRPLSSYPWLKLIAELGKAEKGDDVNIIQHPRGGLKQIAFRRNEVIEIPDGKKDFLYYTTDTEPGSSGSPCFNDQWEVIALHHSGVAKLTTTEPKQILRTDGQVWREGIDPEGLIHWLGNEGARVSAIVAAVVAAPVRGEMQERRAEMLESTAPNPIELARGNLSAVDRASVNGNFSSPVTTISGGMTGQSHTWTIPIQVTVTIGGTTPVTAAISQAPVVEEKPAPEEFTEAITIDPNWGNRKGYDPTFLGTNIPLPKLSPAMKNDSVEVPPQFRSGNDKYLLNYYHYSVVMNKTRRCAWFSAGMIDGESFQDFKRPDDKWFLDTRIDPKFQMGEELYATAHTDRGHLTRFKDLSWGTRAEAVKATNDSFHFTNCSLQLDGFNQGKSRWQGLELFLLEKFARQNERKMVVITGPILKNTDPKYKNRFMDYTARIPLAFWKVCVLRRQDGSLSATAFTLGQEEVTDLPGFQEAFDVAETQVTIADLADLTGLNFGSLVQHDHFATSGQTGALEISGPAGTTRKVKPIRDYDEIVM